MKNKEIICINKNLLAVLFIIILIGLGVFSLKSNMSYKSRAVEKKPAENSQACVYYDGIEERQSVGEVGKYIFTKIDQDLFCNQISGVVASNNNINNKAIVCTYKNNSNKNFDPCCSFSKVSSYETLINMNLYLSSIYTNGYCNERLTVDEINKVKEHIQANNEKNRSLGDELFLEKITPKPMPFAGSKITKEVNGKKAIYYLSSAKLEKGDMCPIDETNEKIYQFNGKAGPNSCYKLQTTNSANDGKIITEKDRSDTIFYYYTCDLKQTDISHCFYADVIPDYAIEPGKYSLTQLYPTQIPKQELCPQKIDGTYDYYWHNIGKPTQECLKLKSKPVFTGGGFFSYCDNEKATVEEAVNNCCAPNSDLGKRASKQGPEYCLSAYREYYNEPCRGSVNYGGWQKLYVSNNACYLAKSKFDSGKKVCIDSEIILNNNKNNNDCSGLAYVYDEYQNDNKKALVYKIEQNEVFEIGSLE